MDATRASLILRLRDARDMAAWDEFAAIYSPVIFRVAVKRGFQPADADNLTQEVFGAVAKSISNWIDRDDRGSFRAWLLRIARNESVNMLTRKATRPLGHDGDTGEQFIVQIAAPNELSSELDLEYQRSLFQRAADQVRNSVTSINWQAFWLTSVEGLSIQKAAEELDVSTGQVYCARSRVMTKIKKFIQESEWQS